MPSTKGKISARLNKPASRPTSKTSREQKGSARSQKGRTVPTPTPGKSVRTLPSLSSQSTLDDYYDVQTSNMPKQRAAMNPIAGPGPEAQTQKPNALNQSPERLGSAPPATSGSDPKSSPAPIENITLSKTRASSGSSAVHSHADSTARFDSSAAAPPTAAEAQLQRSASQSSAAATPPVRVLKRSLVAAPAPLQPPAASSSHPLSNSPKRARNKSPASYEPPYDFKNFKQLSDFGYTIQGKLIFLLRYIYNH